MRAFLIGLVASLFLIVPEYTQSVVNGTILGWYGPAFYENGEAIPADNALTAFVWESGKTDPVHVQVVYPNEYYEWDSWSWNQCYDSTAVDITRGVYYKFAQSDPSHTQCTGPEPCTDCGGICHSNDSF